MITLERAGDWIWWQEIRNTRSSGGVSAIDRVRLAVGERVAGDSKS